MFRIISFVCNIFDFFRTQTSIKRQLDFKLRLALNRNYVLVFN